MIRYFLSAWLGGTILAVASLQTNAAGLGSLEVKSVLGEPLRAEVPVSATAAEIPSLKARLASPSAYEAAGLVYTGIVSQLSVTLKKDGSEPVVLVTSAKPINEPVVDLMVELTWSSGRVSREYTAFIDPPFIAAEREKNMAQTTAAANKEAGKEEQRAETSAANLPEAPTPQPLPAEGGAKTAASNEPAPGGEPTAAKPDSVTVTLNDKVEETEIPPVETIGGTSPTLFEAEPSISPPSATGKAPPAPSIDTSGKKIGVIRGDTLSKIALAHKPKGVTLEQMLVVLFRNNPTAFSGKNMNRLRTGKIIRLGDADEYKSVTQSQALKEVRIQYSNWNAYRERVAAAAAQKMPSAEQPAQQAAAGTVTPKVEGAPKATEKASEVVRLSKGEPASGAAGGAGKGDVQALQEKLVASEKALQESNARVARLEKIIEDLQKLAEVKNQDLAQMQSQAAKAPAAATTEPKQVPAAGKPESADKNAAAKPAAPVAAPAKPEAAATPESGKPAGEKPAPASGQAATAQTSPAAPAAPANKPAKAPAPAAQKPPRRAAPPPPPPPPSLLDRLLAQPYLLAVPLVVLLLLGFGVSRLRNRKREPKESSDEVAPAKSRESAKKAGTFSPADTDVGLASRAGNGGEEVDPLEEAEIFLAYGRDAQAEELLKEALETHPGRFDIHAKLAEIYAKRRDRPAFENLAKQVQQGTGGEGEIWDRVVRLGYSIDPENPRYADGRTEDESFDGTASQPENPANTVDRLDFEVGGDSDESGYSPDFDPSATSEFESSSIVDPEATMEGSLDDAPTMKIDMGDSGLTATDLDLNAELPMLDEDEGSGQADSHTVDFESSGIDALSEPEPDEVTQDSAMDFDISGLSLDSGSNEESRESGGEETSSDMPALDLSGISLDLDGATTTQAGSTGKDEKWYEVQTKFDLAKAYQEMGDNDGAKEILQEVISEGDSEQKAAAESVLASLD